MRVRSIAIVRSVAVIGGTAALMGGVTFAALSSSPVTLADNTISTGTASLQIYDFSSSSFGTTSQGFHVTGLVPGHPSTPQKFYLKNTGDLDLVLTAHVPSAPPAPAAGYGFKDFHSVSVIITDLSNKNAITTNLGNLLAGDVNFDNLLAKGAQGNSAVDTTDGNYSVSFDINPTAVSGSSAGVGSFDIQINGTPISS